MTATTHISMFIFFRTDELSVTVRIRTIDVPFARGFVEVVPADNNMFVPVDGNRNAFVKHIATPIPTIALYLRIFAIADNAALKLGDIFKSFFHKPAGKLFTTDAACTIRQNSLAFD